MSKWWRFRGGRGTKLLESYEVKREDLPERVKFIRSEFETKSGSKFMTERYKVGNKFYINKSNAIKNAT